MKKQLSMLALVLAGQFVMGQVPQNANSKTPSKIPPKEIQELRTPTQKVVDHYGNSYSLADLCPPHLVYL